MCPPSQQCTCYYVHKTIIPCEHTQTRVECCSSQCTCLNEKYLAKLKSSNQELKGLIRKLDNLTDSMQETTSAASCNNTREIVVTEHRYDYCDSCRHSSRQKPKSDLYTTTAVKCDYVVCEKCDQMLRLSELERSRSRSRERSRRRSHSRETCTLCRPDLKQTCSLCKREEASRSRSRSRSRSISRTRYRYSRSRSPSLDSLQRPMWNSGPYVASYYGWRDFKLKEERH
jgi:hypothetical protein